MKFIIATFVAQLISIAYNRYNNQLVKNIFIYNSYFFYINWYQFKVSKFTTFYLSDDSFIK